MTSKHPKVEILPDDDYRWALARDGDIEARNYIVEYHLPLVHQIVHTIMRKLPHSIERDDLVAYGAFGLIKASETYDPTKGSFRTHAAFRINNAVYDGLRLEDWAPKSLRRKIKDVSMATENLQADLEREPTDDEIGEYLGRDEEWVRGLRRTEEFARYQTIFDLENQKGPLENLIIDDSDATTDEKVAANIIQEKFVEWLDGLEDNLKVLWCMLHFFKKTPKETRELLEISPSIYSRLSRDLYLQFAYFLDELQSSQLDTHQHNEVDSTHD